MKDFDITNYPVEMSLGVAKTGENGDTEMIKFDLTVVGGDLQGLKIESIIDITKPMEGHDDVYSTTYNIDLTGMGDRAKLYTEETLGPVCTNILQESVVLMGQHLAEKEAAQSAPNFEDPVE